MNKVQRKLEYSLMALKHMSHKRPGELTSAKEVSDSYHAPFDATAKVMQQMAQAGILRVEHGAMGGYQITKDLGRISLYELMNIVQGPSAITKCFQKDEPCEIQTKCNILSPITNLNNRLNDFYKNLSLKDLLLRP
jgi:Rrf2 family protein